MVKESVSRQPSEAGSAQTVGQSGLAPYISSDPERLSKMLEFLTETPSPKELLRYLVHVPVFSPGPKAGALGMISGEAELVELASYGLTKKHGFVERRSVWQQIPPFVDFHDVLPVRRSVNTMREAVTKAGIHLEPEEWVKSVLIQPVHGYRGAPIGAVVQLFDIEATEPLYPVITPKDFHSALVLAFKSEPFISGLADADNRLSSDLPLLTDRELTCLRLAARGYSNKEIAGQLRLSASTVKTSLSSVFDKLGTNKRTAAVEKARTLGIL